MFKMFSQIDVGTYVCQRELGAATPTEKSFKADFSGKYSFFLIYALQSTNIFMFLRLFGNFFFF